MRKLSILVVFLFLFGLIGATPYVAGYQFKKNFLEVTQIFSENKTLKVEVVEYKQGWLSSDAEIRISLPLNPGSPDKASTLIETINSHIIHGPVIKDPDTNQFGLAMAIIQSKVNFQLPGAVIDTGDAPLAQITSLVDFKNHWHNEMQQALTTISVPELGKFSAQGGTGSIDFDFNNGNLNHLNMTSESKGLVLVPSSTAVIQEVEIDSLNYQSQSTQEQPGEWIGNSKLVLPKLSVKKADNAVIALEDIELSHSTKNPGPKLFGLTANLSIKNIQTANKTVPTLSSVQLAFAINNLNSDGLVGLAAFLRTPHPKPLSNEDRETYQKLVLNTLSPSSSISESFSANTTLGNLQNDANIYWKGDPSTPLTQESLITGVNTTLNIHAATALVDQLIAAHDGTTAPTTTPTPTVTTSATVTTPAPTTATATAQISPTPPVAPISTPATTTSTLTTPPPDKGPPSFRETFDGWIQQGYIIKDGDNYVISLKYENGTTTINGKAMTP